MIRFSKDALQGMLERQEHLGGTTTWTKSEQFRDEQRDLAGLCFTLEALRAECENPNLVGMKSLMTEVLGFAKTVPLPSLMLCKAERLCVIKSKFGREEGTKPSLVFRTA